MALQERVTTFVQDLPVAHRVVIGGVVVAVALGAVMFFQWISKPSYTVLYSGMEATAVSEVITELEGLGIPYTLESGGTTVMVPQAQVFDARARLAGAGVATSSAPQGYELLDGQSLTISDFKQRVDFQRAVEGELARTLMAMDAVESAQVHLVLPKDRLFGAEQESATASVLVTPRRSLSVDEVETVTFLVSSAVEGLEPTDVTVADTAGNVLNVPGAAAGASGVTNRNMRMTQEFEAALATDISRLLDSAVGEGRASVVVNAVLDFDERETETETYAEDSQIALREQTVDEKYTGAGAPPNGGTVGVDGGPDVAANSTATDYERNEIVREYGVDKVIDRARQAPGDVEKLSVAIVMDDGSVTGVPTASADEVQRLVTAAVGLDEARGDTIAVSAMPFPAVQDTGLPEPSGISEIVDIVPQVIGGIAVLAVALYLLNLARRKQDDEAELARWLPPAQLEGEHDAVGARQPVGVGAGASAGAVQGGDASVAELVERQPEEIAQLLRSWLAEDQTR